MKNKKTKSDADFAALVKEQEDDTEFLDRAEQDILKMLKGRSIATILRLLECRVIPAAKRRAKL